MRAFLLFTLLAASCSTIGQVINTPEQDTTEWRGWTGIQLHWKPFRAWTLAVQEQWRWREDFSRFDRRFHQIEVEWDPRSGNAPLNRFMKPQSVAIGWRYSIRPDNRGEVQGVDNLLRWQAEHVLQLAAGRWGIKTRVRFQQQRALALKGDADPSEYGEQKTWRVKGTVDYNIKGWKWDPALSLERFVDRVPEGWQPDGAWRLRLATGRKVAKRQSIRLFLQRDWREQYNPAQPGVSLTQIGAGLDDLRLTGSVRWTAGLLYRYRFKRARP